MSASNGGPQRLLETAPTAEDVLGTEFWVQPEDTLSPPFNLMYVQLSQVLRDEWRTRNGSVLDLPVIERMAYMYAYLRQRESGLRDDIPTDRTRREMNKDWIELAVAMKKMWASEDKDGGGRELVLKRVNEAVASALDGLPKERAAEVKRALAISFESHGV